MAFLEANNICVNYGKTEVLRDVSFSVNRGEIVGLLGHNGCGKTTILKCMAGLIKPASGTITMNETGINSSEYRRSIGYCPQENSFFEKLTVKENVEYFGHLYDVNKNELEILTNKIAYLIGLEDKLGNLAETLSEGQKRRLNIACGIVSSPKILLMDEPSLALDIGSKSTVWRLIRSINSTGTTIIVSSNSLRELDELAHSVVGIRQGAVFFHATASILRHQEAIKSLFLQDGKINAD